MICKEGVFINGGAVRVHCIVNDLTHTTHTGLYQRGGELTRKAITWSGPIGQTKISPPEIPPWEIPRIPPPKKPWEAGGR